MRETVLGGGIAGRSLARLACSETAGPSHSTNRKSCNCWLPTETSVGTAASQFAECPWQLRPSSPRRGSTCFRLAADRDHDCNKPSSHGSKPLLRSSTGERSKMPTKTSTPRPSVLPTTPDQSGLAAPRQSRIPADARHELAPTPSVRPANGNSTTANTARPMHNHTHSQNTERIRRSFAPGFPQVAALPLR